MKCILVIERDEERVRARLRALATIATPVGVTTAEAALHLLETSVFDAVLCAGELGAGQPDGEALLRRIGRRWPRTRRFLASDGPRATSATLLLEPLTASDLARVAGTEDGDAAAGARIEAAPPSVAAPASVVGGLAVH